MKFQIYELQIIGHKKALKDWVYFGFVVENVNHRSFFSSYRKTTLKYARL